MAEQGNKVKLPDPSLKGGVSIEQLLVQRRSIREYPDKPLTLTEVGQLLWSAQGITDVLGLRTAPSAGALYPLELYLVVGRVEGLASGVYHYQPHQHSLLRISDVDVQADLSEAALSQTSVAQAAAVIVFAAEYARTTKKYGKRGIRYVHIEVGHAAENLFLQAEALSLATVVVGAFDDEIVSETLGLADELQVLLLMPVGNK
ncbi:MAG: SagB/ThcOx family dehydrogenase [Thioalkalispiraceae bacterium]|jgi:SagB-type dehydrogenase family enzyme